MDLSLTRRRPQPFEAGLLPDEEKERLCRALLAEFGATNVKSRPDKAELQHSCVLPFGLHRNGDAHPSASLNWKKLTYVCHGCTNGGGLLWFIATCRGETSETARTWLENETGAGPDEQSLSSLLSYFDAVYGKQAERPPPIPRLDPRIIEPWKVVHPWLTTGVPELGISGRGIPEANIMALQVGWDPKDNRIVIPHFWRDELVGWQTRRIIKDGTPKYLSSPDFPKDTTLYAWKPQKRTLVVESPMSVLAKFHLSLGMTATFGAQVTDRQVRLLAECPRVTLWFDNDEAGWEATRKVGEALTPYSIVDVVDSPWAADPADLDDETATRLAQSTTPFSLWRPPKQLHKWEKDPVSC